MHKQYLISFGEQHGAQWTFVAMKWFFGAAFLLSPLAAEAKQLVPSLYAQKYCELRANGVSLEQAAKAAVEYSRVGEGFSHVVILRGRKYNSDVLASVELAASKCRNSLPLFP
jgi:hypothetical protein